MTKAELLALLSEATDEQVVGSSRRIQPSASKAKVTVQALEPGETVRVDQPKAPKAALVIPKGSQQVVYGEDVLVLRKVGKSGINKQGKAWADDYIEFAGFRSRFGDFSLTLKQARMLADPEVQTAFNALMEQIPS